MGASVPLNFETWGLSPPKPSDGCPNHADVRWHRAGFIRCHFIKNVFDPCACTHEDYALVKLQEACLRVYQNRSPEVQNLFLLGQYSSRPIALNRTALAHTENRLVHEGAWLQ